MEAGTEREGACKGLAEKCPPFAAGGADGHTPESSASRGSGVRQRCPGEGYELTGKRKRHHDLWLVCHTPDEGVTVCEEGTAT